MVGIAIVGPLDKLNEILAMPGVKDFWKMSDLDTTEPTLYDQNQETGAEVYIVKWYNDYIKWSENHEDLQPFYTMWRRAESLGLDGKMIEYCYEYPDTDNMYSYINNGQGLEFPSLNIQIDMGE